MLFIQTIAPKYDLQIAWDLVVEILLVTVLWMLAVMNTELLIRWNDFEPLDTPTSPWQFGQVEPSICSISQSLADVDPGPPHVSACSSFRERSQCIQGVWAKAVAGIDW